VLPSLETLHLRLYLLAVFVSCSHCFFRAYSQRVCVTSWPANKVLSSLRTSELKFSWRFLFPQQRQLPRSIQFKHERTTPLLQVRLILVWHPLYDRDGSDTVILLSVLILATLGPTFLVLLFAHAFLGIERCTIRIGIPPMLKSSLRDFVKNLISVSDSWVFELIKATNVGGRAFTWVKYLTFGCVAESFQECRLITYNIIQCIWGNDRYKCLHGMNDQRSQ